MTLAQSPQLEDRKLLLALATIPSIDAVVNQLSNGLQLMLGPVSLLQVMRGLFLLGFLLIIVWKLRQDPAASSRIPIASLAAIFLILLMTSKEFVLDGSVAGGSAFAYGQMAYWVLLWMVVSLLCTNAAQALILLRGLACGALITAASVVFGYFHGGLNYYEQFAIHSSSGWFNTAKMITGLLVCGSVVLLYLGRASKSWLTAVLAVFCCTAVMLTYARAGSVALFAAVVWLMVWALRKYKVSPWRSLGRFLLILALASATTAIFVPGDNLTSRWSDVSDSDQAGSGRAAIWRVARDAYAVGTTPQQVLGRGYDAMSELLFAGYGDDVKHTHNDMLDMLLVGGVAGAAFLLLFVGSWGWSIVQRSVWTLEGCASLAILIDYLCHSQLTGQIWGTDAMTYYVVALTSFSVIGATVRVTTPARSYVTHEPFTIVAA